MTKSFYDVLLADGCGAFGSLDVHNREGSDSLDGRGLEGRQAAE